MVRTSKVFSKFIQRKKKKIILLVMPPLLLGVFFLYLFHREQFLRLLLELGVYSNKSSKNPCSRTLYEAKQSQVVLCEKYEQQSLIVPNCSGRERIVPRILHSVGKYEESHIQLIVSSANPSYKSNRHNDQSAAEFVLQNCGKEAWQAYRCLIAPSFRADLFRFCALYAKGGVYLDEDIVPLHKIDEVISSCSTATVGHDFPFNNRLAKQMKILASAPKAPIMGCALQKIINNVRGRAHPQTTLELTGPALLQQCYELFHDDVAVTYKDTRGAVWPYTGMRSGNIILAYEYPSPIHFCKEKICDRSLDYNDLFKKGIIYNEGCTLS
jgi:mannosyltransferase OCH1-like enzyme